MIRRFFRAVFSGTGIVLMVTIVLSLCLWFLGSYLGFGETRPFETLVGTLVGLAVLWIVALLVILLILLTAKTRDDNMAAEIVSQAADAGPADNEMVTAELAEMRTKLKAALARLRRSKLGRKHLYELPWYIIIGPPGAGKTTAIVNSGLKFPLADDAGPGAIGGVGGTRNCDWWFTDNAVLVDTAGRYTTQESDAESDNASWLGFLAMLKKYRRRQPINGAIVAISLSDLSQQDEITQKNHAAAVRRRLHELREKLGVRFPVYILFTKADLIAGFTEFFEGLPKEERDQVWGFTLPMAKGKSEPQAMAAFDEQFGALVTRLNAQLLDRMQTETDPQRRSLIASFPSQVASVRLVARDFLTEVFQENRYEHRQMLRGVYFASGTQEGTPIDRLMLGMARTFGIGRQAIGSGRGTGRSYFLTRLFDGVIFREAGLVSADDREERRYRWTLRAAVAGSLLVAAGVGAMWGRSYLGNRALLDTTSVQLADYRARATQIPPSPVGDANLVPVIPALDVLRALPGTGPQTGVVPAGLGFGLYQGNVIGNQARLAYRRALNQHFLPRLLLRLEDQIQSSMNEPDVLYNRLKVYLMLGQPERLDAGQVRSWLQADGTVGNEDAEAMAAHLDALLAAPMDQIELNNDLVAQAREVLNEMPLAQRAYKAILQSSAATDLPQFRPSVVGEPDIAQVFVRGSGRALNDGIAGIYTHAGFHSVFLEQAVTVAESIQADAWILATDAQAEPSPESLAALRGDVLALYYNDYVAQYDGLLADLNIIPIDSVAKAAEVTGILAGATSPLTKLLEAVAKETRLAEEPAPPPEEAADPAVDPAAAEKLLKAASPAALKKLEQKRKILEQLAKSSADGSGTPQPPGSFVQDRFQWLQDLVNRPDGTPSDLDGLTTLLASVNKELTVLARSGDGNAAQGDNAAILEFTDKVASLPPPLQPWAREIAQVSSGLTAGATRAKLDRLWQPKAQICAQATNAVYPFDRGSKADMALKDFATVFAPGGLMDAFFAENLAAFVDTTATPWSWKAVNDSDLGISSEVLVQFQNAAAIRDAFFGINPAPSVPYQMMVVALAVGADAVLLDSHGQKLEYQSTQPVLPASFTWPGVQPYAGVLLIPQSAGSENLLARDGPWAVFRLLDAAKVVPTSVPDRKKVYFNVGGRQVVFELQSAAVNSPFGLAALKNFRCPKSF
jgi:type VI secretion system protein ImpL